MTKRKSEVRNRRAKRNPRLRQYKRSVLMVSVVLLLLSGVLAFNSLTLQAKNAGYKEQETELNAQIKEEQERSRRLKSTKSTSRLTNILKIQQKKSLIWWIRTRLFLSRQSRQASSRR